MKSHSSSRLRAFTLIETVIAIGVLAVLLTGFMMVFAPAAAGIRKSLNIQEIDRLSSTLEQELVTFRKGNEDELPAKTPPTSTYTGFEKAFEWIKNSNNPTNALLVYQYRGSLSSTRDDGTPEPFLLSTDSKVVQLPGKDYVLVPMLRRKSDPLFFDKANPKSTTVDLAAVEGGVYLVKGTQLIFSGSQLTQGKLGEIADPSGNASDSADVYPEAVIAFSADFYTLKAKSASYLSSTSFSDDFSGSSPTGRRKPVFSRNLAVRR